jgi:hypothetical protein
MSLACRFVFLGLALPAAPGPLTAHHSTEVFYDRNRTVEFVGILKKLDMVNPHTWFHFQETTSDGQTKMWLIEGDPPTLIRRGMVTSFGVALDFAMEQPYTVRIEPAWRTHEADGYLKGLTLPDGRVFTCC